MLTQKSDKMPIIITMIFFVIVSSVLTFSLAVFVVQLFLASITISMIMRKNYKTAKLYVVIFIVSLIFVFLLYMANDMYYGSPYYVGGSDDVNFEYEGRVIIDSGIYNPSEILESGIIGRTNNAPFFSLYISFLIRFSELFGIYSTFLPRIMNVYYLMWVCMILEYLLKKHANFTDKKTDISIALFSLTPNIQYINSHVFRDTFNLLQILLIVLLFDKLVRKNNFVKKILYMGLLAFLLYITYYTRKNALVFAGAICLLVLAEKIKIKKRYIFIIVIPIVMLSGFLDTIRLKYFINTYSNYVLGIAGDGLSRFIFRQPLLPFGIIYRTLYAFITPFPNFIGLFNEPTRILFDFIMLLIYCGVVIQILFIPFILKRSSKFDWLSLSFLIWFLGIIATTFTFRHVLLYYPFMVALGVDGYLSTSKKPRVQILFISGVTGFLLSIVYLLLKTSF
jgi:hypothetical protein